MSTTNPPRQLTLLAMMLWIAVSASLCLNLKILVDHQDDLTVIWENLIR